MAGFKSGARSWCIGIVDLFLAKPRGICGGASFVISKQVPTKIFFCSFVAGAYSASIEILHTCNEFSVYGFISQLNFIVIGLIFVDLIWPINQLFFTIFLQ
jgi:hypothetical protein